MEGLYWDNGKENGNCYILITIYIYMLALYWDDGKENGNYYNVRGLSGLGF